MALIFAFAGRVRLCAAACGSGRHWHLEQTLHRRRACTCMSVRGPIYPKIARRGILVCIHPRRQNLYSFELPPATGFQHQIFCMRLHSATCPCVQVGVFIMTSFASGLPVEPSAPPLTALSGEGLSPVGSLSGHSERSHLESSSSCAGCSIYTLKLLADIVSVCSCKFRDGHTDCIKLLVILPAEELVCL